MKKILLIAAVAGLAMVSCKKERTCTCTTTTTSTSGTVTTGQPSTTVYKKVKKGDAKDMCVSTLHEDVNTTPNASTSKSDTKCELN
jgi:hypothetical protein